MFLFLPLSLEKTNKKNVSLWTATSQEVDIQTATKSKEVLEKTFHRNQNPPSGDDGQNK